MRTYNLTKSDKKLIEKSKEIIVKSKPLNLIDTGDVGSALITSKGNIFSGVSLGFYCGIGSCAEYQAIKINGRPILKYIGEFYYKRKNFEDFLKMSYDFVKKHKKEIMND